MSPPFSLLDTLFADQEMSAVFSEESTVDGWLRTEVALARAQASEGVITSDAADAIAAICNLDLIDKDQLWAEARTVGYPILSLVRMVSSQLPDGAKGKLHLGATTQDIMDTGLALQLSSALSRLGDLVTEVGEQLAALVDEHRSTIMAGRTHGQQAVPTTLGAKLAVFLTQFQRHRDRIAETRPRLGVVSIHGAGGTSAAYGPTVSAVRRRVAESLRLRDSVVPWHVARDGVTEFGIVATLIAETCVRLAREIIDLSRTEIGEIRESSEHHHGASSTMPQKVNPIWSETIVGFGVVASSTVPGLLRAIEAGHERAAGEWQVEWDALPRVAVATASALSLTAKTLKSIEVDKESMLNNLAADGGLIMAEALMMRLAPIIGREDAHDLVYEAATRLRSRDPGTSSLVAETRDLAPPEAATLLGEDLSIEDHLGEVEAVCAVALAAWASGNT